jgi:predicted MFS family arabinose efflux permease
MIDRLVPATIRRNWTYDFSASLLVGLFLATVLNFVPVVARRLGADSTQLALVVAAPLACSLLTPLFVYIPGPYRFQAMLLAWAIARASFVFTLLISTPGPFVVLVIVFYVFISMPSPAYVEVMSSIYPANVRGQAMSYVRAGMTATMTIATPLAGWLMDRVGYAIPFALGAAAALLSTVLFAQIKGVSFTSQRTSLRQVVGILAQDRGYAIFSLSLMFMGTGYLVGAPLFAIIQVDELRLSYEQVGILSFLSSLLWMVGSIAMGRLLDRRGALLVMLISVLLQMLMPLCYFLASDVLLVALAFAAAGLASASGELGWLGCVLHFAGPGNVPGYSALHMLLLGVRGLIGPVLGAALISVGGLSVRETLFVSFLLQLIGAAIMVWVDLTYRSLRSGVNSVG